MNTKELFEKRLLRKIPVDKYKVEKSLEIANKFLSQSKEMKGKTPNEYIILATYSAMFHASRAILYSEGIQEKSHKAVIEYLKENYGKELENLIFEMDAAREQRHEGLYGLETSFDEEEVIHSITIAEMFVKKIKKIIQK